MRRRWLLSIVLLVSCKREASVESHSPEIEARVRKELQRVAPDATITRTSDDHLALKRGDWSVELSLDNVVRSCASSTAECDDAIASIVEMTRKSLAAMSTPVPTGSAAGHPSLDRSRIRLTPKPDEWIASADNDAKTHFPEKFDDNRLVRMPFAADLNWLYAFDEPGGMKMISQATLRDLGMTPEELHALAIKNLAEQYPTLALQELSPGVSMWTIEPGDYLDSARLALTDQWRAEAKKRGGTLIASVPARSRVFATNDPKLRVAFEKVTASAFATEDHALSAAVLEWTDTGWKATAR